MVNLNTDRTLNQPNDKSSNDQKSGMNNTAPRNSVKFTAQLSNELKSSMEFDR
jgi:hypothetical protein